MGKLVVVLLGLWAVAVLCNAAVDVQTSQEDPYGGSHSKGKGMMGKPSHPSHPKPKGPHHPKPHHDKPHHDKPHHDNKTPQPHHGNKPHHDKPHQPKPHQPKPHQPKPHQPGHVRPQPRRMPRHNVTHDKIRHLKPQPHHGNAGPAAVHDNLAAVGYQESNGVRYLYYSYAAYCAAKDITNWSCRWCSDGDYELSDVSTVYDSKTNTFGFIGYNAAHNEIVVTFRGTVPLSLNNWIADLSFAKTDLDFAGVTGAHVHHGFYTNYNTVAQDTEDAVKALRAQYPSANVYFTGHSLGGALATLATLDAAVSWNVPSTLLGHYTFGSPRVGDATFATAFTRYVGANNHFRVVNDDDLVPHLPLKLMGFHHISTEVWLHDDTATVCDSSGEDPHCSDSTIGVSVYDHLHYYGYFQIC